MLVQEAVGLQRSESMSQAWAWDAQEAQQGLRLSALQPLVLLVGKELLQAQLLQALSSWLGAAWTSPALSHPVWRGYI